MAAQFARIVRKRCNPEDSPRLYTNLHEIFKKTALLEFLWMDFSQYLVNKIFHSGKTIHFELFSVLKLSWVHILVTLRPLATDPHGHGGP